MKTGSSDLIHLNSYLKLYLLNCLLFHNSVHENKAYIPGRYFISPLVAVVASSAGLETSIHVVLYTCSSCAGSREAGSNPTSHWSRASTGRQSESILTYCQFRPSNSPNRSNVSGQQETSQSSEGQNPHSWIWTRDLLAVRWGDKQPQPHSTWTIVTFFSKTFEKSGNVFRRAEKASSNNLLWSHQIYCNFEWKGWKLGHSGSKFAGRLGRVWASAVITPQTNILLV